MPVRSRSLSPRRSAPGWRRAPSAARAAGLDAQLGELRPALVTSTALPARRPVSARALAESVTVRRVPSRFLPAQVLSTPAQLIGRTPVTEIPTGSYVVASQLRTTVVPEKRRAELEPGRRPVEITVSGAGTLADGGGDASVDVVVTTEGGAIGAGGRTYVAARGVQLVDLRPAGAAQADDPLPGPALDSWVATLALTRAEALRLIHAESFARSVRLIEG